MPRQGIEDLTARRGWMLPERTRRHLHQVGIWCDAGLSVEHQKSTGRWLICGKESGGAVAQLGRYIGFCREDGHTLSWLFRVRNFMPNGLQAVVLVPDSLVRLDLYRFETSYDLLITRHWLHREKGNERPRLWNETLFSARYGTIDWELWGKDMRYRGGTAPLFLGRNGDEISIPETFRLPVFKMVEAVTEIGCRQPHLLEAPLPQLVASDEVSV
jgi:hypothetical protein